MEKESINQSFFTLLKRLIDDGIITEGVEFRVEYEIFLKIRLKCLYPFYAQLLRQLNHKPISIEMLHSSLKSCETCDIDMSRKNYRFKSSATPTSALVFYIKEVENKYSTKLIHS